MTGVNHSFGFVSGSATLSDKRNSDRLVAKVVGKRISLMNIDSNVPLSNGPLRSSGLHILINHHRISYYEIPALSHICPTFFPL